MIDKGKISALFDSGVKATVIPSTAQGAVTPQLVVPKLLIEGLTVGMEVVYAIFSDNTGIILERLDGDWGHKISDDLTVEGDITVNGDVASDNLTVSGDVTADGTSLASHTHGGVASGDEHTDEPD